MALDLTPEEKARGQANFETVSRELATNDVTRRQFMKTMAASAGAVTAISAAAYFQYSAEKVKGKPVRTGLIGAGDEAGVLMGEHNPEYLEIVAVADIRPSNQKRIFLGDREYAHLRGDPNWEKKNTPRKGLNYHYGADASKKIKVYDDYKKILQDKSIEAVVIALPLFLHAPVAIEALRAGKHVLCEKLMAWNITQCKEMIKVARENDRILSIGHQRHYSMLYAHAVEVMHSGILGDVRHIRALWHRNNAIPVLDKDGKPTGKYRDSWKPDVPKEDADALAKDIRKHGYKSMEELVRWRLYNRTGAGLMAELGSHQLDACSIFLGKVHPLAVSGVGGKYFYKDDREVDDHVFVSFEFPGPSYFTDPRERKMVNDKNDVVVVTYSSISTNAFEPYGECVMGSKGTMVVQEEQQIMLYPLGGRSTDVKVSVTAGGQPVMESSSSPAAGGPTPPRSGTASAGPVSRGYREEMEHFAYCIRMWDQGMSRKDRPQVRCPGPQAMADAIIALTSNIAMREHKRIEFKEDWFDPTSSAVPDPDSKPQIIT